jgi:ribosomal protein L9
LPSALTTTAAHNTATRTHAPQVPSISSVGSVVASLALHKEVKANLKLTVVAAG